MTGLPLVTVLIPARNEATDIEQCLGAVAAQDYPVNRLEVIVVDGMSEDGTADVARRTLRQWGFASSAVVVNEGATTPSNLNLGMAHAAGEILCRVDARTLVEPHFVRTCVEVLERRPEVAVVGGAQVAVARDPSARARGIARALNNRYSMGGSRYRRSISSGESDTVYLGAFRTRDLVEAGGWDEDYPTNQDYDLNRRLGERGLVWFEATLRSGYLPRSTLRSLWQQYRRFGEAKVHYWRTAGQPPQPRQMMALAAPVVGIGLTLALPSALVRITVTIGTLLSIDHVGVRGSGASAATRLWSAVAVLVVTGGWTFGAWTALVRHTGRPWPR